MDSHVDLLDGSELHDMCARGSGGARAPYSSPDSGDAPPGIPVDFFGQLRSGPDRKLVLWNAAAGNSQFLASAMGWYSLDVWIGRFRETCRFR